MTERQAKLKITKIEKLIEDLEMYKSVGADNTPECKKIKKQIAKLQNDFLNDQSTPIKPTFFYDIETGGFK